MMPGDSTGRLADEVRLLVDLIVDRAAPWLDGLVESGHGSRREETHGDAHANTAAASEGTGSEAPGTPSGATDAAGAAGESTREWCPFCAVLAVCRGERVDVVARVVEQLTQLLALLRAVLADRWHPQEGVHMPGFDPVPRPGRGADDGSRVQHVTVRPRTAWRPESAGTGERERRDPDADGRR